MKSVLQANKKCFVCGTTQSLQLHHIFGGALRGKSDKYGYVVHLCIRHHTGQDGVHRESWLNKKLKQYAQEHFEQTNTREEFIKEFGKNYLEV